MRKIAIALFFSIITLPVFAVGIRVDVVPPFCNILLTDSNPAGVVDAAVLSWGPSPGDRSGGSFTVTPFENTTCEAAGITVPAQYYIAAKAREVVSGVLSDESIEIPFVLPPTAPTLEVQP